MSKNEFNNNIERPTRDTHTIITSTKQHAVTSTLGKDEIRHINITKKIVDYFFRESKQDKHIAKHMVKAIAEAEQS